MSVTVDRDKVEGRRKCITYIERGGSTSIRYNTLSMKDMYTPSGALESIILPSYREHQIQPNR